MKVRWTPEAETDRLAIWTCLAERDPAAALDLDERFGHAAAGRGIAPPDARDRHPSEGWDLPVAARDGNRWRPQPSLG